MKQLLLFISIIGIISLGSCRKDFSTQPSTGQLEFSKDTVFFDTIFTNIGSSTYTLKVYNHSNDDISIPTIQLNKGESSGYRLNVDGIAGKSFVDVEILAKDSLFVFIETTINYANSANPLYVDELLFDAGENQQDVKLVTLVQDAHFLFPTRTNNVIETLVINGETTETQGRYLTDAELTFTNDKPYVIYGYMMVGTEANDAKTLSIEAGVNVHFHANSGLIVNKNSSLHVLGTRNITGQVQTEVVFQGDRLEPEYENIPGQWGNIILFPESIDNKINYATIKNGSIGIIAQGIDNIATPVLEISNSQLYNNSLFGILGIHSNIKGSNLVINNSGFSDFAAMIGGVYHFTHCTFANSWGQRSTPNIWLLDSNSKIKKEEDDLVTADFYEMSFTNCIIDGNRNIELEFDQEGSTNFNFVFTNNLIKFDDRNNYFEGNPFYDFTNTSLYLNTILNEDANFKNPSLNELIIGEASAANGQAATNGTTDVPTDILEVPRANPADIGAYEHIVFD